MTVFRFLAASCLALCLLCPTPAGAVDTDACLGCHTDGEIVGRDRVIDPAVFASTAHAEVGCPTCHDNVGDDHPGDGVVPNRPQCAMCHEEVAGDYSASRHAAYADCADCHNPHRVQGPTVLSGVEMNQPCLVCHSVFDVRSAHAEWLPQVDLHLDALPCISCHTRSPRHAVTFWLTHPEQPSGHAVLADRGLLRRLAGTASLSHLLDSDGSGEITADELRAFHRNPRYRALRLQGMILPEQVTHQFDLLQDRWNCSFCHSAEAAATRPLYLAWPNDKGTYSRTPIAAGNLLGTLEGVPDFYMTGATRVVLFDRIGLIIIALGLVMPVGHGTLRFLTRKNRRPGARHES